MSVISQIRILRHFFQKLKIPLIIILAVVLSKMHGSKLSWIECMFNFCFNADFILPLFPDILTLSRIEGVIHYFYDYVL
jgi:hypothetical protein